MGKSTISMTIFNSYFDITRGYLNCWRFLIPESPREDPGVSSATVCCHRSGRSDLEGSHHRPMALEESFEIFWGKSIKFIFPWMEPLPSVPEGWSYNMTKHRKTMGISFLTMGSNIALSYPDSWSSDRYCISWYFGPPTKGFAHLSSVFLHWKP